MALQEVTGLNLGRKAKTRSSLTEQVCAKLRKARRDDGKTLKDIARIVGTTPQTVQRLENGTMTVSLEWLEKICAALRIDPAQLFDDARTTTLIEKNNKMRAEARVLHAQGTNFLIELEGFLEKAG